jgi:hypothetical protein
MAPDTAALVDVERVNDRLDALRRECVRQKGLIYACEGVPASEVLPFLDRIISLTLTLQGTGSMDTVIDVIDMLDEGEW